MMRAAVLALTLTASPALAWDSMKSLSTAIALGDVMASEAPCGLSYDPDKIAAWIEKTVPADDMEFTGRLNMMTVGKASNIEDMSPSSKAAHCSQIRRVAKSYGFTG